MCDQELLFITKKFQLEQIIQNFFDELFLIPSNEIPDIQDIIVYFGNFGKLLIETRKMFAKYFTSMSKYVVDMYFIDSLIFYVIKNKILESPASKPFANYLWCMAKGNACISVGKDLKVTRDEINLALSKIFRNETNYYDDNYKYNICNFNKFLSAFSSINKVDGNYDECYKILPEKHHKIYQEFCDEKQKEELAINAVISEFEMLHVEDDTPDTINLTTSNYMDAIWTAPTAAYSYMSSFFY